MSIEDLLREQSMMSNNTRFFSSWSNLERSLPRKKYRTYHSIHWNVMLAIMIYKGLLMKLCNLLNLVGRSEHG